MNNKNQGSLTAHKMREATNETSIQEGKIAEASKEKRNKAKKKKIVAGLVSIGVLGCFVDAFGVKGIALVASFAAGIWLVFRLVKQKSVKIPAITVVVFLIAAFMISSGNIGGITQKQLIEDVTKVMEPVGYQLIPTDDMSDNTYLIYVKDSPTANSRPNGVRCDIVEDNGHVESIVLISTNGSKGIPMSAMKFVSALNPGWSSSEVTDVMTMILKGQTVSKNGITYTFNDLGTSSQFVIELK